MQSIQATEQSIRIEKDNYVLTGKIDLLMSGQSGLEIIDFKTHSRPQNGSAHLSFYKQQLYLYAYALQRHTGQLPLRLFLYWTAEESKDDALMEVPYQEADMQRVIYSIDNTVAKIQQRQFEITVPPDPGICKNCDVRYLCRKQRFI
jgi:DNA helicase-2/ATP-dependent DNA helicase PcrA